MESACETQEYVGRVAVIVQVFGARVQPCAGMAGLTVERISMRIADRVREIIRGVRSAAIDDYQSLMLRSATATGTRRYRPADKGHKAELAAFRAAIEGRRDGEESTRFAVETSVVALVAIESLMSGSVATTRWPSAQGMARR